MQHTLRYGICKYSGTVFASYGAVLGVLGKFEKAYQFGCLSQHLLGEPQTRVDYARAIHVV